MRNRTNRAEESRKIDFKKFAKLNQIKGDSGTSGAVVIAGLLWLLAGGWSFFASWQGFLAINIGWFSWAFALISQAMTLIYVLPAFRTKQRTAALLLLIVLVPLGHVISYSGSAFYSYMSITQVADSSGTEADHTLLKRGKDILRFNTVGYGEFLDRIKNYYAAKKESTKNGADPSMSPKMGGRYNLFHNVEAAIAEAIAVGYKEDKRVSAALAAKTYQEFYSLLGALPPGYLHLSATFNGVDGADHALKEMYQSLPPFDFDAMKSIPSPVVGRKKINVIIQQYPFMPLDSATCPPPNGAMKLDMFIDMLEQLNPTNWFDGEFRQKVDRYAGLVFGLIVEILTIFFNMILMQKFDLISNNAKLRDRGDIVSATEEGLYELVSKLMPYNSVCLALDERYWATLLLSAIHRIDDHINKHAALEQAWLRKMKSAVQYGKLNGVYKCISLEELRTDGKADHYDVFECVQLRLVSSILDHMERTGEILVDNEGTAYACMVYLKAWLVMVLNETGVCGSEDRPGDFSSVAKVSPEEFVKAIAEIISKDGAEGSADSHSRTQ